MTKSGGVDIYKIYCDSKMFVYSYNNSITGEYGEYVIDQFDSDFSELINHLENLEYHICFDGLKYDYQIIDDIISSRDMYNSCRAGLQLEMINRKSKYLLSDNPENLIGEQNFFIPQLDLSKLLGLNTAIRTTSIKDLCLNFGISFSNNSSKILDNIKKGGYINVNKEDISAYLKSSIEAILCLYKTVCGFTDAVRYKDYSIIDARRDISKYFKTKMTFNMSNVKAGEVLACRLYCKANNIDLKSFPRPLNTSGKIKISSIIPDFSVFNNKNINSYKEYLSKLEITPSDIIEYNLYLNDINVKFGNGGVHGCVDSGIFESNNDRVIVVHDITSFYASIICYMGYFPAHLNESFVSVYKSILDGRLSAIDTLSSNHPIVSCLKEMLNGIYGKLKESNSNLYDPSMQLKTIIASQMFTCMWLDTISSIDGVEFISVNTDGMMYYVDRSKLDLVNSITKNIIDNYGFRIKTDFISKLYLKDVNNYAYISESEKVVKVGVFDNDFNIYKSKKNRDIANILYEYFIEGNEDSSYLRNKYGQETLCNATKIIYPIKEFQLKLF